MIYFVIGKYCEQYILPTVFLCYSSVKMNELVRMYLTGVSIVD